MVPSGDADAIERERKRFLPSHLSFLSILDSTHFEKTISTAAPGS